MLAKGLFSLIVCNLSSNRCCSLLRTTAGETQFHFNMNCELFTQVLIKAIKATSSLPFTVHMDSEAGVARPRILDFNNGRRSSCLLVCFLFVSKGLNLCLGPSIKWGGQSTYLTESMQE